MNVDGRSAAQWMQRRQRTAGQGPVGPAPQVQANGLPWYVHGVGATSGHVGPASGQGGYGNPMGPLRPNSIPYPAGPRSPQDAGYEVDAPYGRHPEPFAPGLPWHVQVPNQPPHGDLPIMRFIHFLKSLG